MNSPELSQLAGHLFVIAAPSGAGKTSLVRALIEQVDGLEVCVSHTTRTPRSGERDGVDYHFVDEAGFRSLIERDAFLEWAEYQGHLYGTSRDAVRVPELGDRRDVSGGHAASLSLRLFGHGDTGAVRGRGCAGGEGAETR